MTTSNVFVENLELLRDHIRRLNRWSHRHEDEIPDEIYGDIIDLKEWLEAQETHHEND